MSDNPRGATSAFGARTSRNLARVRQVQQEAGPGDLFKNVVLGSLDMPLTPEEYRRRQGLDFTSATPAVIVGNPADPNRRVQIAMRRADRDQPDIVVLLQPGNQIWLPVLEHFVYEACDFPPVISCAGR